MTIAHSRGTLIAESAVQFFTEPCSSAADPGSGAANLPEKAARIPLKSVTPGAIVGYRRRKNRIDPKETGEKSRLFGRLAFEKPFEKAGDFHWSRAREIQRIVLLKVVQGGDRLVFNQGKKRDVFSSRVRCQGERMGLKRREFLHRAGLVLAALGISEREWWQGSRRYYQALAQPTRRKLALLVGINKYPGGTNGFEPLRGCLTDLELQREVLIGRFGFQNSDIITLGNEKATRENIETAFADHLIAQAKPGDVVVFHFSGYGSYIPRPDSAPDSSMGQNALVPVDGTGSAAEEGEINDLLEDTLWLLLRSLATHQVITVLDTGYTYPGVSQQGAFRIRASGSPNTSQLSRAELDFQEQLLSQLNLSREQLEKRRPNQFPGLVLAATKPSQVAVEVNWDNWSAGLFTHTLTQTLWSAFPTEDLKSSLIRVAGVVEETMGVAQQPQLYKELAADGKSGRTDPQLYKTLLSNAPAAKAVIQVIEDGGKTAKLLLTGVPACILQYYEPNSLYTVIPDTESEGGAILAQLLIRSRTGLTAKATVRTLESGGSTLPEIKIGQRAKEAIRVLPRQIPLKVALDPKLARIERVDATSAFSGISNVSVVTNDQPADYILGRVRDTAIAQSPSAPLPSSLFQGRYGLFLMGQALLPESVGEGGEAVKVAVQRLAPQLKTRLAAKLFNLTQNEQSSLMKAKATLALLAPEAKVLIDRETAQTYGDIGSGEPELEESADVASPPEAALKPSVSQGIVSVPIGNRVQYRLQNNGNLPLYFIWFHLDTRGQAYLLDPILEEAETDGEQGNIPRQQRVAPGKTVSLPQSSPYKSTASTEMAGQMVQGPAGLAETYLVVSHYPFTQVLKVVDKISPIERENMKFIFLSNPLEIAEAVLEDLNKASQLGVERAGITTDGLALDINAWATFNFIYRVV